jgi:hypothetical protein
MQVRHRQSSIQQEEGSFHQQIGSKFLVETVQVLLLEHNFVWCRKWTLRKTDQKYVESFEMWCCRRMKKTIWTDYVRNEVLNGVKEVKNILLTIKRRKG